MAKSSPLWSNFTGGELSPISFGRVDAERYQTSLQTCLNFVPLLQGGLTRRPGTKFVAEVKDSTKVTRLVAFKFSTDQAYIIEFGDLYCRFYRNNAIITQTGTTITGATAANPVVITAVAHGLSNGNRVLITGVGGMVELNNREFIVQNITANTAELQDARTAVNVDGTGFTAFTSGGTMAEIVELTTTYAEADLFQLSFAQSADTLYIAHKLYEPRKITRTSHVAWTITVIAFEEGPFLNIVRNTTFAITGGGNPVTVTASSIANINRGDGFKSTDVGRFLRLKRGFWGVGTITGFTSSTVVSWTITRSPDQTTEPQTGALGVWSATTGYPSSVIIHENRTVWGGATDFPDRIVASHSGNFELFAPTGPSVPDGSSYDNTITDSHPYSFTLGSKEVNAIRWMSSDEKGLLIGTSGSEWLLSPSSQQEAISPTNVNAKQIDAGGVASLNAVQIAKTTLFVHRSTRKLYELHYFFDVNGFRASDMTILAPHVPGAGIDDLASALEPQPIVWAVREDGMLLALTYERDINAVRAAWSRHTLGGDSDAGGTDAAVRAIAVIPSSDETSDEVWLIVERWVNGLQRRYVEYIVPFYDENIGHVLRKDSRFLDSHLTRDDPKTISGATQANPVVITATAHGFSNAQAIRIDGVVGMTNLNGNSYTTANVTANTFELSATDGTAFSAYVSGGEARSKVTALSGLHHLEGEVVQVVGDGIAQADKTVANGKITAATAAGTFHVGYSYNSDGELLRTEAGARDGTALGKTRIIHAVSWVLYDTMQLKHGRGMTSLEAIPFDSTTELFTGLKREIPFPGDYDTEGFVAFRVDGPVPATILAIAPRMDTSD